MMNQTIVQSVKNSLKTQGALNSILKLTTVGNLSAVQFVSSHYLEWPSWKCTWEFTQEKDPSVVHIVAKHFRDSGSLKQHFRAHTGYKLHVCPECNKSFAKSSMLKRHTRVHTGEKPYKCSLCTKSFGFPSNLTAHMALHTGEKLHTCSESWMVCIVAWFLFSIVHSRIVSF